VGAALVPVSGAAVAADRFGRFAKNPDPP